MIKQNQEILSPILAESLRHGAQVAHLALQLFDGLAPLHKLSKKWREILDLGAQLHDIGWIFGKQGHHKASAAMIRDGDIAKARAVPKDIRHLVALVARYHRRAAPSLEQKRFASLSREEQKAMYVLASIVRLADALDFSHFQNVQNLKVTLKENQVIIKLAARNNVDIHTEICRIEDKKELFEIVFSLDLICHSC